VKAAIRTQYGPPESLKVDEIEIPAYKENEVLIKVYATTVNRTDYAVLTGKPFIMRFFTGLFKPTLPVTGTDFAGKIEAVGKRVNSFKVGDKVWGFYDTGLGSHAQYLALSEDKPISFIPDTLSYEETAASAEGAHYAYNFIKKTNIKAGQRVLVNGATGAIGTAAVQLLKYFGVWVTAVCNTRNIELIKTLGADKIIDYTKEDFTQDDGQYNFVFDAVGKSTFARCKPLLHPRGIYISSELGPRAQNIYLAVFTPIMGGKKVVFPIPSDIKGSLQFINRIIEQGKFKPVIDRMYPLERIADAFTYVATGEKTGNVVITTNDK